MNTEIRIIPITGIGEVAPGTDLGLLIFEALQHQNCALQSGDILVITQKIVSKAEGRIVHLEDIEPSPFAVRFAAEHNKDARHVEVVLRESKRIVRMDRGIIISETHHGFICANAGVDESNVEGGDILTLLPEDSDASASHIRQRLQELHGETEKLEIAVIISDTWGRPWRSGQVNMAIGVAGMNALTDYRGQNDPYGFELRASIIAVADELAAASELVMGKVNAVPVALIRGYEYHPGTGNAKTLLRESSQDMFR
ncbi:coenzyme F420-0:L-glutamate ligase/coenzyme F420-1:gamma-L-glutamate ligase [Thermosporothrix hazakensis]|jgi:coenzyme F420-0:L-glutamate ligase/coenzyme F420-1:gamma-L-glutamate ligase|uniref:Coenzyme F420-0:L-glutamate ligase/coenzyme F420-1:gamma-L-glutamate ligase n=2 Tax=Thermosporothrix TaxID=768650 RepID=A0A326U8R2_THEHA|nr:coenzyme F420-0:L-glutamate ligase [Thermosporothrix hazakensis]PZW32076.1 coenzyme F420-0:L-glutamate ligase/coenzyme F420-1:gamma-L-glutamate ligase [Thermosporothrix hazakensis]BBH91451.1 F420-0--gamma-glutamyl ligase [Thermosporothrix sp. COM3]GCE49596.1 F420-0--gamma-glutamyl ligase [Thermosporothrix hazakensis]